MTDVIEEKKIVSLVSQLKDQNLDLSLQASERIVALGTRAVPYLLPLLEESEWSLRFRVASLIQKLGIRSQKNYVAVEKAFSQEKDKDILKKLGQAISESERIVLEDIVIPSGKKCQDIAKLTLVEWFEKEEAEEIQEILKKNGYIFQRKVTLFSHPEWENYYERHTFLIHEEDFENALEDLLDYFGFGKEQEKNFTGECPACGTPNQNVDECIECGLNLTFLPSMAIQEHPFFAYLLENGLLPETKVPPEPPEEE